MTVESVSPIARSLHIKQLILIERELKNTNQASTPPKMASLPPVMGVNPRAIIVDEYLTERRRNNLNLYNLEEPSKQETSC